MEIKVSESTILSRTLGSMRSAGLDELPKVRAEFKHVPPKRAVPAVIIYEGLVDEVANESERDKAIAWATAVMELRVEREERASEKLANDIRHRKEAQRSSADYDSGLSGVITPKRVARTHVASSDIVSWYSE